MKKIQVMEQLSNDEKLRKLGLFSLEKDHEETSLQPSSTKRKLTSSRRADFLHNVIVIGQEGMALN